MEVNNSESNVANNRNNIQLPPLIDLLINEGFYISLIFQVYNNIDSDSSSLRK